MRRIISLLGIAALAACSDSLPVELTRAPAPRLSQVLAPTSALSDAAAAEHVVLTTGSTGPEFDAAVKALGGTIVRRHDAIGVMAISGLSPSAVSALEARGEVKGVAPDAQVSWVPPALGLEARIMEHASTETVSTETDQSTAFFYTRYQWNMRQIDADVAWRTTDQGAGALVCILDTGIDPNHIDLRGGKVDLAKSRSFVPSEPFIEDLNFHGTFVAALISSNGLGMASVAPDARLCAVKVLARNGRGAFSWIIAGMMHATDVRADVMNLSLGAYFNSKEPGALVLIEALQRALEYASNKGTLVVAASGNNALNLDTDTPDWIHVPSQLQKVVSVGATAPVAQQNFDRLASYSNFGTTGNDLTAPGGDFVPGGVLEDLVLSACSSFVCGGPNFYLLGGGTSFAAPHVSGAAAVFATNTKAFGGDNTDLVKRYDARYLEGCIVKGLERPNVPNSDVLHGQGRLNVERSMLCGSSPKPAPAPTHTLF